MIGWPPDTIGWAMVIASPFVGSFLGVAITRIPAGEQFASGRSVCDHCGRPLSAFDLMPVVSWIVLRGRCRRCGARLSVFYPLIELAALAVALLSVIFARGLAVVAVCLVGWSALVGAGVVWRRHRRQ